MRSQQGSREAPHDTIAAVPGSIAMPNAFSLNRTLGGAIAAIAAVALLSGGITLLETHEANQATAAQDRSRAILAELEQFRAAMLNQEAGVRGFLLTGRRESLAPYEMGRAQLERTIGALHGLIDPDPDQARRLDAAQAAARNWQVEIGQPIADAAEGTAERREQTLQLESTGSGKRRFDAFREALSQIEDQERRSLEALLALARQAQQRLILAQLSAVVLTLLICLGAGIVLNRMVARPLLALAAALRRLVQRDTSIEVPAVRMRSEVGEIARAVEVFKASLVELDRTELLRVTTDTLPAMVGYVDAERRVGFLNSEFSHWFNLEVDDVARVKGRPLAEVLPGLPGGTERLEAALAGREVRFEQPLFKDDGSRADLEGYFRPHRAPDGRVLGAVALLTDVTERNNLNQRLARQAKDLMRSNEELEQFAYVASHDLKAPLRGIDNLVNWIEEDLEGVLQGETRNNMELLKRRVKRLEKLLDDLLAYSRAGRSAMSAEDVDTRQLVEELAVLVSPPDGFRIEASPSLPVLVTSRAPLTQVLQNLISNAIKHHDHPESGRVSVEAKPASPLTTFTVSDDGPGIPEQFRDRVFGMFQTLRPRDDVEGSGMGLAIVKKLIERQGGTVWLGERPEGRGLAVHFTWPGKCKEPEPENLTGADHGTSG